MNYFDLLPKIAQYEDIPYRKDFTCPCGKSNGFDNTANLIGWCDTPIGIMVIFECPVCFQKYRFHCGRYASTGNIKEIETSLLGYMALAKNHKNFGV